MALAVPNEQALLACEERLKEREIGFRSIRESSGKHAGELMAIGIFPAEKEVIRRHVSSLALLR